MQHLSLLRQLIEENRVAVKQSREAIEWSLGAIALLNRLEEPRTPQTSPLARMDPKPPGR